MSSIWEGLPSGERKPIFSLPYLVKTVLSLPSQLVLLTEVYSPSLNVFFLLDKYKS